MDTITDSESEEEINDLLKEAADCEYVNKLYNNKHTDETKIDKSKDSKEITISSHQIYLAKSLTKRLDKLIKIYENGESNSTEMESSKSSAMRKTEHNASCGIKLFSDSVYINDVEEEVEIGVPRPVNKVSEEEYSSRAAEAAVSSDWVLSQENTSYWKFFKPKIIQMKVVKKTNGKLECVVGNL